MTMVLRVQIKKRLKAFRLDMEFEAGRECLGILGPSGCGKSMTLKSVAGIVTPDEGRIAVEGDGERVFFDSRKRVNLRPQKRQAGYVFQQYALFPNMTVEQNIMTGLKGAAGRRMTDRQPQAAVREWMERFRLTGLEGRYPSQLSGGQQQRTALARSLASRPAILLLDEPFAAMDTFLREGLRMELKTVLKDYAGISVLVTHDRDEAYQLCSRLILMDEGKVLAAGGTREVFENPGTCRAARLTGCKNISRIERLGRRKICALDWGGLKLATACDVDRDVTAVGIRAHDFSPLSDDEASFWKGKDEANLIPVKEPVVSEMPFEWYVTLDCGLWWKTEKTIYAHDSGGIVPPWLRIAPEGILLLRG